jgi:hypothetical protein
MRPGAEVAYSGGALRAGSAVVDCAGLVVWTPSVLVPSQVAPPQRIARRIAELDRIAGALGAGGVGEVVARSDDSAVRVAGALAQLRPSLIAGDCSGVPAVARSLTGLGPGLTPSGDDVLGGLLFALLLVVELRVPRLRWSRAGGEALVRSLAGATHPISLTIMADLAVGSGPEPLHQLAWELFDRDSGGPRAATLERVLAIGSGSGRDLIAGFRAGLSVVESTPVQASMYEEPSWLKT